MTAPEPRDSATHPTTPTPTRSAVLGAAEGQETAAGGVSEVGRYLSVVVPYDLDAADLSEWLSTQDVALSPETLRMVLTCTYLWLSTYENDAVNDVLLSLQEDLTAHRWTIAPGSTQPRGAQ